MVIAGFDSKIVILKHLVLILICSIFAACSPGRRPAALAQASTSNFSEVQHIFKEHCLSCHGTEKHKGGLRLDRVRDALAGGDDGPAIVPGKSAESLLIKYVKGLDPEKIMPPKGDRLSSHQIEILSRWIDQGAIWPKQADDGPVHWAFKPLSSPRIPSPNNARWTKQNPIDNFVLARLESLKFSPSPRADKSTLIRRLSLDLTGLPPAPERVNAFLHDARTDAYEHLVDELLASPHFGEQWARHWLDLARYADSDGYEKDFYRPHAWRWREWVIDSVNRDQPFDEFTRDQIAGDLLPDASLAQKVATGFHRNTLLNREGGVDIEEDRCKIVVDRVSTVGSVWLGLTVGCAECHAHKYDPISQKEFYQLYAFFNSTDDRDIRAPLLSEKPQVDQAMNELRSAKEKYLSRSNAAFEEWAMTVARLPDIWKVPRLEDYELPTFGANNGANLYPQEDGSFIATGMIENKTHYIMMLNTRLKGITGIRVEAMTDEMLPLTGPGWSTNGGFVLTELYVESASLKNVSDLRPNPLAAVNADYSAPAHAVNAAMDGNRTNGGWAVDVSALPFSGLDRCAVFTTRDDIGFEEGTRLKVSLVQNEGHSQTLGRFRVTYTTDPRGLLKDQALPERIRRIAALPPAQRSLDDSVTLRRYYDITIAPKLDAETIAFSTILAKSPSIRGAIQAPVLSERANARPTYVHVRGNFLDHGAEVQPGTLSILPSLPRLHAGRLTRLDLANWIISRDNPLTARVAVNRVWSHLFGEGLVSSVADFGAQGEKPSHPELLDWLAHSFMENGWSRKALIRLIVTSSTYRQSSAHRPDLDRVDEKNQYLARQNRFRLAAENVRDQILAGSGLLESSVGGPSVDPSSHRRGMYLKVKRSQIDYLLTSFDAPNTTQSCPRRERSNTPLQALTLLNDKLFMDGARHLGARLAAHSESPEQNIDFGFQLCFSRPSDEMERKHLLTLYQTVKMIYEKDEKRLGELIPTASPRDKANSAAWIIVARALLNSDELITRE